MRRKEREGKEIVKRKKIVKGRMFWFRHTPYCARIDSETNEISVSGVRERK